MQPTGTTPRAASPPGRSTRERHRALLPSLLLVMVAATAACSAVDGDSIGDIPDVSDWEISFDSELACYIDPNADSDGDGLLDIVEDANRNCTVDPGETDPHNPDSDGDGLLDGDEDVDGNGIWDADRGEFNPLVADTDGNGVPDGEEPRRFVCNRQRAQELLSARVVLSSGMTLLRHPAWTRVRPLDSGTALVLGERQPEGIGVLGIARDPSATLDELIREMNEVTLEGVHLTFAGRTQSADRRQSLARWTASVDAGEVQDPLASLVVTFGERMGLDLDGAELPLPAARDLQVQVAREERGATVLWTLAVAGDAYAPVWLNAVHPQAVAPSPDARARLVCEDLDALVAGSLEVVLVGANISDPLAADVAAAVEALVASRSADGLTTRVHVVSSLAHDTGAIGAAREVSPVEVKEALIGLGAGVDERPLMHAAAAVEALASGGATAAPVDGPEGEATHIALVMVNSGEDSELREGTLQGWDGNPELPPRAPDDAFRLAREQAYAVRFRRVMAHVVGLGSPESGAGCAETGTDGSDEASLAVERVSVGAGGFFVSSCLTGLGEQLMAVPFRPLASRAYSEPAREAVWGTLLVATEQGQRYPGAFGLRFGRPVLVFPPAFDGPVAPVSYTAWD